MKSKSRSYKRPGSRSRKSKSKKSKRKVGSRSKKSKKSPTKGWANEAPKKGRERNIMLKDCGSKCFLEPSKKGFPVCKANRSRSGKSSCKPNCKGIISAYVRAKQWKHYATAKKAIKLAKKYGCSSLKKSL